MTAPTVISALLQPRAVAVYGASATPGKLGHSVLANLVRCGFPGGVIPVHPQAAEIEGVPCHPSLAAWRAAHPGVDVDCVFLAVPAAAVPAALADCERAGARSVIVGSSGYAELGDDTGRQRQAFVTEWARRTGARVLGPNTNGILSVPARLSLGYNAAHARLPPAGPVSVVSHSGALFDVIARRIIDLGCGLSRFVPVGNEADITLDEVLAWLVDDPHTRVIGLVIEGLGDGERFRRLCLDARARGKFVVALKLGRGARAAHATQAHSSRLAGAARTYDALFASAGVAGVDTIEALAGACALLAGHVAAAPPGEAAVLADRRWVAVTTSGAGGALVADMLSARGLDLAGDDNGRWPPRVEEGLRALPTAAPIVSPIDTGSLGDWSLLEPTWAALEAEGFRGPTVAFAHRPASAAMAEALVQALAGRRRRVAAPVVLLVPGGWDEALEQRCRAAGVVVFRDTVSCFDSLAAFAACVWGADTAALRAGAVRPGGGQAHGVATPAPTAGRVLTELESARLLAAAGVPMVASHPASGLEQALAAARAIGFPVVLKAQAEGVAHKNDLGLVQLGIADEASLARSMETMRLQLVRHGLDPHTTSWIVQPQLRAPLELLLGMSCEPALGRFLIVGLGGLLAEEVDAVEVFRVDEPGERIARQLGRGAVARMIARTAGASADAVLRAVLEVVERLRGFALQNPQVESVDINPLLAGPGVCTAVDALVVLRHDGAPALPIPADALSPVLHAAPAAQVGAHHSRSER